MKAREGTRRGSLRSATRWVGARAPLLLLVAIVFLLPLFFWPGATEYNYARTIFLLVSTSALAAAHAASALHQKTSRERVPAIAFPFAGLLVAGLASLAGAAHAASVLQSALVLAAALTFFVLAANTPQDRRDVIILLSALCASTFLVAAHAILQYVGLLSGAAGTGTSAMIATMGNRDAVAGFLGVSFLPIVFLARKTRPAAARAAVFAAAATIATALVLAGQLAVFLGLWAALLVVTAIWAWLAPPRAKRRRLLLFLSLAGATLLAVLLGLVLRAPSSGQSLIARLWDENSGRERTLFWNVATAMWVDRPLLGVGLGNYKLAFPKYKADVLAQPSAPAGYFANAAQTHNDYLQLAAETGTLGVLAAALLAAAVAVTLRLRLRRGDEASRKDLAFFAGGLVVFAVHALFGFPAHLVAPAFAALLIAAIVASPAYGDAATFSFPTGRRARQVGLVCTLAAGLAVSVLAARDLHANVLELRGTRLLQLGNAQTSLDTLERSLALDVAPRQTHFYVASAQYRLGRYDEALASLARCLTVFPNETAYVVYGDLAAGLGDLDGALAVLDFLLSTHPSPANADKARYVRALTFREKGYAAAAEAALRELIADSPGYEAAYITLGEILADQAREPEALALYEEALALIDLALPEAREAADAAVQTYAGYVAAQERLSDLTRERARVTRAIDELARP